MGDGVESADGGGRTSASSSLLEDSSVSEDTDTADRLVRKSSSPSVSSPRDTSLAESPPSSVKSVGAAVRCLVGRRREKNIPAEKDMELEPSSPSIAKTYTEEPWYS